MKASIIESKPKNPKNTDNFEKPLGRRATNIATRISQIKRVVKKYGIDKRTYDDGEKLQALRDYKRSIENSLGVSVVISHKRDEDNEYIVKISYDDGISISGYIRLYDNDNGYDSSLILWPREENVVSEGRKTIYLNERALRRLVNEAINNL